jgi:DNA-binding response OmpR family regulator
MMPNMNGYDVCKNKKKIPQLKDIPIIFLTAKSEQEDIIRGFEVGGVDYITKPFNSMELKMRIRTHIELNQSKSKTSFT